MTTAIKPIDDVRSTLDKLDTQLKAALPPQMDVARFKRTGITSIQQNPKLMDCNRSSLFGALMKSAQEGLMPDGKEAALVIYGDQVVFMPMTYGILKKVRNSGVLKSITPNVIHKNDKFRYWIDSEGDHIEHEPLLFGDRGEMIGVYAIAITKDGGNYIEVMTCQQIEKVRNVSRAKNNGPWKDWYDEMSKKTVIRRLSKRLPMSTDLEETLRADDALFDMSPKDVTVSETQPQIETPKPEKSTKPKRLQKLVEEAPPMPVDADAPVANGSETPI